MYKYQIKKGAESRIFAGQGVKNNGDGTVESDHELNSPYLEVINDSSQATAAEKPAAAVVPTPSAEPAKVQPAVPVNPPNVPQGAN